MFSCVRRPLPRLSACVPGYLQFLAFFVFLAFLLVFCSFLVFLRSSMWGTSFLLTGRRSGRYSVSMTGNDGNMQEKIKIHG